MSDCICCLSHGANGVQAATLSALAAVVGLGVEQVMADLCTRHRETVNAAVRHARAATAKPGDTEGGG